MCESAEVIQPTILGAFNPCKFSESLKQMGKKFQSQNKKSMLTLKPAFVIRVIIVFV
jgi:hypothetical protein